MRVLISRCSDGVIGGAELSSRDHAEALATLGHKVIYVSNCRRFRAELEELGVRYIPSLWPNRDIGALRPLYYFAVWPLMWVQYLFLSLSLKPDIINPHSREDQIIWTLLKPLHRHPVVWRDPSDLRHLLIGDSGRSLLGRFNERLLRRALLRANTIYTLTEDEKAAITAAEPRLPSERVQVFPSSVLYRRYDRSAKPPRKQNQQAVVIGTALRLVEDKGVQYLIQAVQALPQNLVVEVWIVGDGDYRTELETMATSSQNIRFWGHQEDTNPYFAGMDIFVQPAEWEGWGRNVKEAMYFGLAVVGSRVGGIARQIEDGQNGLLFTPKSVAELTAALTKLIESKSLRQKLGKAAKAKTEADGDFVTLFKKTVVPQYEQLLKEGGR